MRTGSPRNALFAGEQRAERRWFTVAASLPVLSMDAERAARLLVRATMWRRPEVVLTPLTPPAQLGIRAHALAPSTSLRLVAVVNRLLPRAAGSRGLLPEHALGTRQGWFARLTRRDRAAARSWHEFDDPTPIGTARSIGHMW